jgi:chromosome segregation ATPase
MSNDLTQKRPGDQETLGHQADDKLSELVSAVQSLNTNVQSLNGAFKDVEVRLEVLEATVSERLLETKPIWERALAEIAETRAELAETRAELAETREELKTQMNEGFRKLGSKMEVLNDDLLTLRGNQRLLDRRVENLESKTP